METILNSPDVHCAQLLLKPAFLRRGLIHKQVDIVVPTGREPTMRSRNVFQILTHALGVALRCADDRLRVGTALDKLAPGDRSFVHIGVLGVNLPEQLEGGVVLIPGLRGG